MKIKNVHKGILVLILATQLFSADFASNLERLMGYNAKSYAMPLVEGFGSSLNAGLYKKASVSAGKLIPFGFDVGIVTISTMIPEDQTSFKHRLEDFTFNFHLTSEGEELEDLELSFEDIYSTSDEKTPNIAGDGKGVTCELKSEDDIFQNISAKLLEAGVQQQVIDAKENDIKSYIRENLDENFESFSFPKGLGLNYVGSLAAQANVRLPLIGLEITGRYLPAFQFSGDIGEINLYGLGVRKSLPVPIIDVTAGIFLQKFNIGEIFDLNSRMVHLEVGKSIGIPFLFNFSPYAGIGFSQTTANLNYTVEGGTIPGIEENTKLEYEIEPDDQFVMTVGATAQIIPLTYINVELNQSNYLTGCIKLGLILK